MQALTYVESIGCLGNELCPEPAKERQYVFPHGVNERDFRDIYNQLHAGPATRYERTSVLGGIASESPFKLKAQSVRRILYVDA